MNYKSLVQGIKGEHQRKSKKIIAVVTFKGNAIRTHSVVSSIKIDFINMYRERSSLYL